MNPLEDGKVVVPPVNLNNYAAVFAACLLIGRSATAKLHRHYGCWTGGPKKHPWHSHINDMACGHDRRMSDFACQHCHRQREEDPLDQIPDARGYAQTKREK